MIILPNDCRGKIIQLMRDRPLLPISLLHLAEVDILFISSSNNQLVSAGVQDMIAQKGVSLSSEVSSFLRETLLKIPLIDEQNGLTFTDYVLVREPEAVSHLIETAPARMRVFPSKTGLKAIYPESAAPGYVSEPISNSLLSSAVLFHDYTSLQEAYENENPP